MTRGGVLVLGGVKRKHPQITRIYTDYLRGFLGEGIKASRRGKRKRIVLNARLRGHDEGQY